MKSGWFQASCHTWAGGVTAQCQECYQQARAQQDLCERQSYEDDRFDTQQGVLLNSFEKYGAWVGGAIVGLLILWWILKD
ncbi:hypothetical protein [Phaeocystidibacter luteus]|uniref:Uncharacterized protein n=1 Tax=Phaeocystidibacter luteus TaxID=911197 RepID=A0A6N6RLY2_9FLAO|nr:hypothetical protein [Phaeocystidibacter luteus]KAB2814562.1 hypothetical protein F8C67_02145 [Phaeocystidibacter luteus]